jgi:uncharacterized membrane protein YdbT with pleckstrin-like domain
LGYVETILEPGERITHRAHLHWIIYMRGVLLAIIGGFVYFAAPPDAYVATTIGLILVLLGALSLLGAAIRRWTTEIAVTDRRVILKRGLIEALELRRVRRR